MSSVNLDNTVDLCNKPKAGKESNSTCQHEEQEYHNKCISEVKETTRRSMDFQLRHKIMYTVNK